MITALLIALLWPLSADLPDDAIVARATKGDTRITISAGRLRAYAADHPDRSPRALAQELIEFELLAAEAARQALADDAAVREAVARAMVRRMLIVDFEATWSADRLPEGHVRRAYERNIRRFVRPALRVGDHLLITIKGKRPADPTVDAAAKALMLEVRADLDADPPADREAFMKRAERFQGRASALGVELRAEALGRFQRDRQFVEPFAKAMFALPSPGITPVFATDFGWHIGRVDAIEAPVNRPFEEVEDELRARIVPEVRKYEFGRLTEQLGRAANAMIDFGPLERQAERLGLESPE